MRKAILILCTLLLTAVPAVVADEQASDGGPGEHLDLFGVLDLFREAESVEVFEKRLNDSEGEVNNLDLNEDNQVDYVTVIEEVEGDTHVFVLRVPLAEEESQDIATIELEKSSAGEYSVQIVGDEEIYGPDYIVEPEDMSSSAAALGVLTVGVQRIAGLTGVLGGGVVAGTPNTALLSSGATVWIRVSAWPIVRVVYAPGYRVWRSPYYWGYYPRWWRPWRPVSIAVYRTRTVRWVHRGFTVTTVRRSVRAPVIYKPHRRTSTLVVHKHKTVVHKPAPNVGKKTAVQHKPATASAKPKLTAQKKATTHKKATTKKKAPPKKKQAAAKKKAKKKKKR